MIIAIDGPAASGKGTLGRRLAAHYGYRHLDTGLLYRAVAKAVLDAGKTGADQAAAIAAARNFDPAQLSDPALKTDAIGNVASVVSAIPEVRAALIEFQRRFAAQPPGAVLDGRDIGTVIAPQAEVKIFLTASPQERARRRFKEAENRGENPDLSVILADIEKRDARDANRAVAPFKPAPDAHLLDTTHFNADETLDAAMTLVERVRTEGAAWTIYVRLLGEGTDVFRPVPAAKLEGLTYLLKGTKPDDEDWEFAPGAAVQVEERPLSGGRALVAIRRA